MVCHYRKGFGCVFGENAQSYFLVDFQGEGGVEPVSCDQMRLCLNNKNGTHGEFRCNWQRSAVGWWRILLERPLALQQVSGEERDLMDLPATHQPFVQLQMWGGKSRK